MKYSIILLFVLSTFFGGQSSIEPNSFAISKEAPPKVYITGSSSLHDWKVTAAKISDFPEKLAIQALEGAMIDQFGFQVEVVSMDGGRGASMNSKIKKALQAENHPMIIYAQTSPAVLEAEGENTFNMTSQGELTIAGLSKPIEVAVTGSLKEGNLIFKGEKALKMSDFNITPPSAMFGQIVTKDDIKVHFEFKYIAE